MTMFQVAHQSLRLASREDGKPIREGGDIGGLF